MNILICAGFFQELLDKLHKTIITDNRYLMFLEGLGNTLMISIGALLLGIMLGLITAIIKYSNKKFKKAWLPAKICDIYIYIIRGTPVVLQLMIMYFIILASVANAIIVAIIAFGVNSGAYVAEIIRGGFEAVDDGQMEAGRSLGFSAPQSMRHIVIPQAIKRALPAFGNEFIALIKETSVAGYVAIMDVTFAANRIQSRTLDAFFPLIIAALIYLVLVYMLTFVLKRVERRLAQSDRN